MKGEPGGLQGSRAAGGEEKARDGDRAVVEAPSSTREKSSKGGPGARDSMTSGAKWTKLTLKQI